MQRDGVPADQSGEGNRCQLFIEVQREGLLIHQGNIGGGTLGESAMSHGSWVGAMTDVTYC